jgi:hypothetical protein
VRLGERAGSCHVRIGIAYWRTKKRKAFHEKGRNGSEIISRFRASPPLLFAVRGKVVLGSMFGMFCGMDVMCVRQVRVVSSSCVIAALVMLGGFVVMARSVLMVFRCLLVMMRCFL